MTPESIFRCLNLRWSKLLNFCSICAVAAWALAPLRAEATVMIELPMDRLTEQADLVVRGTVLRVGSKVHATKQGLEPRTHVWLRIDETVRGTAAAGEVVHIWEQGGRYGEVETVVAGAPHFELGEDVLVFLSRDADDPTTFRTVEMTQGKFHVLASDAGTEQMAIRDFSDVAMVKWRRRHMEMVPPAAQIPVALKQLKSRVRSFKLRDNSDRKAVKR